MLEVHDLHKSFKGHPAVRGVSLRVQKGEAFGLLGPNGAGKTTTISLIAGLLRPDSGTITVAGHDAQRESLAVRRLLGVVPQEIALYPTLSARENVYFWGRMYGLRGQQLRSRADAALETVGLADRARDTVQTFSGGMKRRLNIAASLLHEPQLLIMDEPTVGIDPQSRHHILATVKSLVAAGVTVVYTSHYMEEVEHLCDKVAIMDRGTVIAAGTLAEVKRLAGADVSVHVQLAAAVDSLADHLRQVEGVREVGGSDAELTVLVAGSEQVGLLVGAVQQAGGVVKGLRVQEPNLESVFLHLTGRSLRD